MEHHSIKSTKKILVLGPRLRSYPRNAVLLDALRDCFDTKEVEVTANSFWGKLMFLRTIFSKGRTADAVFVVQPAQEFSVAVFLFRIFSPKTKIIFDAFTSLYDTYVFDRKLVGEKSLKARYYFLLDILMCRTADVLIFDTKEHEEYFRERIVFSPKTNTTVLPVSVDLEFIDEISKTPRPTSDTKFSVVFAGHYIPLQGIEYIVEAVRLLQEHKDIQFTFVGSGQTRGDIEDLISEYALENVTLVPRMKYSELIACIKSADVSLGIFGDTAKAGRVIPNKVIESLACRTLVITGENSPMKKHFSDGEDLFFVPLADGEILAEKILEVQSLSEKLRASIKDSAYAKIEQSFSKKHLTQALLEGIDTLLS